MTIKTSRLYPFCGGGGGALVLAVRICRYFARKITARAGGTRPLQRFPKLVPCRLDSGRKQKQIQTHRNRNGRPLVTLLPCQPAWSGLACPALPACEVSFLASGSRDGTLDNISCPRPARTSQSVLKSPVPSPWSSQSSNVKRTLLYLAYLLPSLATPRLSHSLPLRLSVCRRLSPALPHLPTTIALP